MNEEKLKSILDHYRELERKLNDPDTAKDQVKVTAIAKEKSELETLAKLAERFFNIEKNLNGSKELLETETDEEMKEIAREEISSLEKEAGQLQEEIKIAMLPTDPNDEKNVIIEIRPGAGGDESELFAAEILRAYLHYAERQGWKGSMLDSQTTGIGGLKSATLEVRGNKVYSKMKYESGVHRVQRVPETEKQGRVHTSTITVAVLPEAEEADIEIKPEEIRVDVYRSSGHGGQSVNTTDSAVRITHLPTGIIVTCQDEKSQLKNKAKALNILRSRLLATEEERLQKERKDLRLSQVGTGDRSEKIRTYNFPQDRLTDHRINQSWHALSNIMAGDIEPIIEALVAEDHARKLAALNE